MLSFRSKHDIIQLLFERFQASRHQKNTLVDCVGDLGHLQWQKN